MGFISKYIEEKNNEIYELNFKLQSYIIDNEFSKNRMNNDEGYRLRVNIRNTMARNAILDLDRRGRKAIGSARNSVSYLEEMGDVV